MRNTKRNKQVSMTMLKAGDISVITWFSQHIKGMQQSFGGGAGIAVWFLLFLSYYISPFSSNFTFCKMNSLGGKKIHPKKPPPCWWH